MVVRNEAIYFSRFPDVRVSVEHAAPEETVTFHEAPDGLDVVTWIRDQFDGTWERSRPLLAANLASARSCAPSDAYRATVPEGWRPEGLGRCLEAWVR